MDLARLISNFLWKQNSPSFFDARSNAFTFFIKTIEVFIKSIPSGIEIFHIFDPSVLLKLPPCAVLLLNNFSAEKKKILI